ncbi:MAG: hypothetical protein JSV26_09300 [bacterium]|nr:MAG: hypothetical protein JSV26_09300 [bacterium]
MPRTEHSLRREILARVYYAVKPLIPRSVQIRMRRRVVRHRLSSYSHIWPIDPASARPPEGWSGWPGDKRFALVLTHDVESEKGLNRCRDLVEVERARGFRSSFNFVAKKYAVPADLRRHLGETGFEVGVHGLYHDGKKFNSLKVFNSRVPEINRYLREWEATGFRAPSMHCNLEWIGRLDIQYDMSTFDTDPFEPKSKGVGTIFPFVVPPANGRNGFVELPYTLPQDFTLFIVMGEGDCGIWKRKLDWIAENGGMALINVHPDYLYFGDGIRGVDEYPVALYEEFLDYAKERFEGQYYHATAGGLVAAMKEEGRLTHLTRADSGG